MENSPTVRATNVNEISTKWDLWREILLQLKEDFKTNGNGFRSPQLAHFPHE